MEAYRSRATRRLLRYWPFSHLIRSYTFRLNDVPIKSPIIRRSWPEPNEKFLVELIGKSLPLKAGAFLDVGVNVGQTLMTVKAADRDRAYVGFEPNPTSVFFAEKIVEMNSFGNCKIIPLGLASQTGLVRLNLYTTDETDASASIIENFRPGATVQSVKFVPVAYFPEIETTVDPGLIGLVKIDVEGAELDVLRSLKTAIARDQPWIFVEILPAYDAFNTARLDRQAAIEALLTELSYDMYRVKKSRAGELVGLAPIQTFGVQTEVETSDYCFAPTGARPDIERTFRVVAEP